VRLGRIGPLSAFGHGIKCVRFEQPLEKSPHGEEPNSSELTGNFAIFKRNVRKYYDEAERSYRKALELEPNHVNNARNFANFMKTIRK
jgi:hypothetical protein